ncbi:Ig-like domain-containing protein [Clostridium sp. UBA1652]|uniref:Ig-like domain-containing protein n=1 Tax=Clostridium sp. UBA1652 TaxID=1946348 RepID=UPI00257CB1D9|nr:Ig-like domain-containing protein [Clostridium sp. UBA1652]
MKIQSKKKFIAFSLVVILATIFSLTWIQGDRVSAATVGQVLTSPETGWRRFDDTDSRIKYMGENMAGPPKNTNYFNGGYNGYLFSDKSLLDSNYVKFRFYGTKIRIISDQSYYRSKNICIEIDDAVYRFSEGVTNANDIKYQVLTYENTNLSQGIHSVKIYMDTNTQPKVHDGVSYSFSVDAIDIDSSGYLVTDVSEISLNKTSSSLNIGETEDLIATVKPDNASIKDVTWSSSDESVATVDENGKVTAIKAGNATITAKTTDGSNLTATCDVTVVQPSNDRAILAITMTNGQTKEYDLHNSEIESFINWFDSSNGKGQPKFGFTKKIQPYKEVKEYVVFDKISSYEFRTYTVSN